MSEDATVLDQTGRMSPKERAAALAHWIYVQTSHGDDNAWSARVGDAWNELDTKARDFNLASIERWARSPAILDAWVEALEAYRKEIGTSG